MWLLSTDRAELHFFPGVDAIPNGGYAILSHVWGTNEQTFQDLCSISERCKSTGENPRDLMGPKIKGCCLLAAQHGLLWIWIDTGCIDKTSSAELSEAINSMFQWYKQADVCYAYLADVPADIALEAVHSPLRRSIWHTRGWTLQELIAPEVVVFLSRDWKVLGDKVHLAPLLEQITNVPKAVLHHQIELSTVSVAQRMSWAAHRKTTRLEDEAYCLLGIFSINMPTLYGEGRAAFRRLQEEIMQTSTDLSLLAWGPRLSNYDMPYWVPAPPRLVSLVLNHEQSPFPVLPLATAPSAFDVPGRFITPTESSDLVATRQPLMRKISRSISRKIGRKPQASWNKQTGPSGAFMRVMPYGVHIHVKVVESPQIKFALLDCGVGGQPLGLLLHQWEGHESYGLAYGFSPANSLVPSDQRPPSIFRLIDVMDAFDRFIDGKKFQCTWMDIHVTPPPPKPTPLPLMRSVAPRGNPFWISPGLMRTLVHKWDLREVPLGPRGFCTASGTDHATHLFSHHWRPNEALIVATGLCPGTGQPWAHAHPVVLAPYRLLNVDGMLRCGEHFCPDHHIQASPTAPVQTRAFGTDARTIRLSFRAVDLFVHNAWAVDITLSGSVYDTFTADPSDDPEGTAPRKPQTRPPSNDERLELMLQMTQLHAALTRPSPRPARTRSDADSARRSQYRRAHSISLRDGEPDKSSPCGPSQHVHRSRYHEYT
ncbi:hypothetical protein VTO73DRAFT_11534 [Trametes versicolor]